MKNTSLCYIEQDGAYLMLHRVKKENDLNHDKWIGIGGKFEENESPEDCVLEWVTKEDFAKLPQWAGDRIFLRLMQERVPFFSLKLRYEGEHLAETVLNGLDFTGHF